MIRAQFGEQQYWEDRLDHWKDAIERSWKRISEPSKNPVYRPQYVFDTSIFQLRLLLTSYSFGAPISDLSQHFPSLLNAWELSNRLSDEVCKEHGLQSCRDWDFSLSNLNHYNWCFWLVGLALSLEIPNDQWQRLLALIGGEGEDVLLDRVIASRSSVRKIGTSLLHAKPYARLLRAVDAPKDQQATLLRGFVEHWYAELKRPAPKNKKAPTLEPFWYIYGDPEKNPLEMGSYFGRWCIEAVAAVKAFGLDDSLCLGHEHYPGDLLRPNGPSTHPLREAPKQGLFARLFGKKPG
ncbi:MAG: DUF1911 domain-containing protein [Betaproteobacteria bacterium]|nr:DUF1911 domain-containing protein [Betaproteobacteria bacterium]